MEFNSSVLLTVCALVACFFTPTIANFYSASDDVVELTPTNFDKQVINDDAIWVVEFYAPWCGHCQSLSPEYKKLAKALKGIAKVGAINADEHKSLGGQYGVRGFPTIKIFGANKRSPIDFNGERTAKGMANAALDEIRKKLKENLGGGSYSSGSKGGSDVIELTDDNFDKLVLDSDDVWLVEFFAPWCGHCKNLAPEWEKAATELKGKVKLGALDATAHESRARDYDVRGYPTIKFFPAGKKSRNDAQEYNGGRTASDIVAWALEKHADSVPAPEVVEILDTASFEKTCDNKPLCVIAFLPHILDCDAKCRNDYLKILRDLGEQYKQKLWGWGWTEGSAQTDLEQTLEVGGFGYPAMAVANFKKMKFSLLKGSFGKDGINEFLRDISYGRGQTSAVRGAKLPNIVSVEAWNGKDGELPQDEDLDLSDVNLDDIKDEL